MKTLVRQAPRYLYWLLPIAIFYIIFSKIDGQTLVANAKQMDLAWLGAAVLVNPLMVVVAAARWHFQLNDALPDNRQWFTKVLRVFWSGLPLALVSPSNLGWDAYRVVTMGRINRQYALNAGILLLEKYATLLATVCVIVLSYILLANSISSPTLQSAFEIAVLLVVLGVALLIFSFVLFRNERVAMVSAWITRHLREAGQSMLRKIGRNHRERNSNDSLSALLSPFTMPRRIAVVMAYSVVMVLLMVVSAETAFMAANHEVPLIVNALVAPVIFLATLLPITIAGLGVREASYVLLYAPFGVPPETALLAALITFLSVLLSHTVGGVLLLVGDFDRSTQTMADAHDRMRIPFNKPFLIGKELQYMAEAIDSGHSAGDGRFTKICQEFMVRRFGAGQPLLTTSCTTALEMAAILADIGRGDEVILPSYTFVSTANAFVMRGATVRFVDIRGDTLNIDESLIEAAITDRTKAIVPVHYAGVGCEMDTILAIAGKHGLVVIEDAAQGVNARYRGRYLGTIGDMGAYSFHETKNFICGEGGALVSRAERFWERAEIVREKGTNRSQFFRGEIDKYTWVDVGSSFLPSDLLAAFLYAQFEHMEQITKKRKEIYTVYQDALQPLEDAGAIRLPRIPTDCETNYHMFHILLDREPVRARLIEHLGSRGISAVFHYVPLHSSPMGLSMGYREGELPVTENISEKLLRLPFYYDLTQAEVLEVVDAVNGFFR